MNEVFLVKSSASYYLKHKNELYSKKQWCVGLSQSRRWHPKSGHLCLRKWKTVNLHILSKEGTRYKEMETKLSISIMQNLLETCWFFITKMCGIWRITFLSVLFICYFIYMLYNNYVKVNFMERIVIIIIIQISYQFENFPFARKIKVKLHLQWTSFSQWFKGSQERS